MMGSSERAREQDSPHPRVAEYLHASTNLYAGGMWERLRARASRGQAATGYLLLSGSHDIAIDTLCKGVLEGANKRNRRNAMPRPSFSMLMT